MGRSRTLRGLAWLLVALTASGCSSWQGTHLNLPTSAAPGDSAQTASLPAPPVLPNQIRLHLADGTTITLEHPRVDGDSLRGMNVPMLSEQQPLFGHHEPRFGHAQRAVALADIRQVESKRFNGWNTLILVVAIGGLLYLGGMVAYGASLSD